MRHRAHRAHRTRTIDVRAHERDKGRSEERAVGEQHVSPPLFFLRRKLDKTALSVLSMEASGALGILSLKVSGAQVLSGAPRAQFSKFGLLRNL